MHLSARVFCRSLFLLVCALPVTGFLTPGSAFAGSSAERFKVDDRYGAPTTRTAPRGAPANPQNTGSQSTGPTSSDTLSAADWLARIRDLSQTGPGRFYFGLRGGYMFKKDYTGRAAVTGYGDPPDNHIDFGDALAEVGGWKSTAEAEASVSLQLGYTWFLPALRGRARLETDFGYNFHTTKLCTRAVPDTALERTEVGRGLSFASPPDKAGVDALFKAYIDRTETCTNYDEPVYTFLGNMFYDFTFAGRSIATLSSGLRTGLHLIVGAGAGYALNENSIPRTIIAADAIEPKINDSSDRTFNFDADADDNTQDTVAAAPEAAESGFLLPAYVGAGYSLEYITGEAILFEMLYRYNVLAPEGFEGHAILAGIRYRF